MLDSSPQLLRSQAVAREATAVAARIEGKVERFDATMTRGMGAMRADVAAHKRLVRVQYGCLIAVSAVTCALVWTAAARAWGVL